MNNKQAKRFIKTSYKYTTALLREIELGFAAICASARWLREHALVAEKRSARAARRDVAVGTDRVQARGTAREVAVFERVVTVRAGPDLRTFVAAHGVPITDVNASVAVLGFVIALVVRFAVGVRGAAAAGVVRTASVAGIASFANVIEIISRFVSFGSIMQLERFAFQSVHIE